MENKPNADESIFVFEDTHEKDKKYTEVERLGKTHWQSDYARDIFLSMQEQEQRRRPLQFLSMQIGERQEAMQLLQRISRTFKLSRCALHLALYYLDRFADYYNIRQDKFPLVSLACLHIAAQLENTEALVPRYSEMNRFVQDAYTADEYKVVERKILCFFNFELLRPTTASFVELFSCSFLTRCDFVDYIRMLNDYQSEHAIVPYQRYGSFEEMLASLAHLLLRLANLTLSISSFGNVMPSLLAAACIAAVRQVNGVKRWTPYLTNLTTYTEEQVDSYSETVTMYYYYQISPPPSQVTVLEPEKKEELPICDHTAGQNWSSPDSGFEEHSSAHAHFKDPLTANADFKEPLTVSASFGEPLTAIAYVEGPLTAGTDLKEPLTVSASFETPLTASAYVQDPLTTGTDFKDPFTPSADLKEPLIETKNLIVIENNILLTMGTYPSVIPVQLEETAYPTTPAPTSSEPYYGPEATLQRPCLIPVQLEETAYPTTPAPTSSQPYYGPETILKRPCQEEDVEGVSQPYKKLKLATEPKD